MLHAFEIEDFGFQRIQHFTLLVLNESVNSLLSKMLNELYQIIVLTRSLCTEYLICEYFSIEWKGIKLTICQFKSKTKC